MKNGTVIKHHFVVLIHLYEFSIRKILCVQTKFTGVELEIVFQKEIVQTIELSLLRNMFQHVKIIELSVPRHFVVEEMLLM